MITSGAEHNTSSWNLAISPSDTTLDALLCSDFSPFHSGDHRKMVRSADPHLIQVPGHRAQVLSAHDTVKLLLTAS